MKGVVSGTAAGVRFEQPVELAAHEDRTVVFTPEKFPQLRIHDPKLWWPYQMGEPHLEHLTVTFSAAGHAADEQSVDFGIREITSEYTANGSRLFRVNGKPILIRGARLVAGHAAAQRRQRACATSSAWCATCT